MKKTIVIILMMLSSYAFSDKLRIGVEGAYPPFSQTQPDGSVVGFDIDIANALCDEMGAKCKFVIQDWDGMIPALLARKYDAIIASMTITEERKKKVAFTNKYYSSPAKFIKNKNSDIRILNSLMKGLTVGVQQETIMDKFLTDNWGNIVKIKRYVTQNDANQDLLIGRLDLVFSEIGPGDELIKRNNKLEFVGPSYSDSKWFGSGIGIALRKGESKLKDRFNDAIKNIRNNGVYDKLQSKYFTYDIYGD
jgi:arginine/ornithine transport system substrate-binding protein